MGKRQIISISFSVFLHQSKCTPVNNGSALTYIIIKYTDSRTLSFQFNDQDILKVMILLHVDKAHGCDDVSIGMIKMDMFK